MGTLRAVTGRFRSWPSLEMPALAAWAVPFAALDPEEQQQQRQPRHWLLLVTSSHDCLTRAGALDPVDHCLPL